MIDRYHAEPVYDVHDCGPEPHERYICGWDVVDSEGIYAAGPFCAEYEAADEARRLNLAAGRLLDGIELCTAGALTQS